MTHARTLLLAAVAGSMGLPLVACNSGTGYSGGWVPPRSTVNPTFGEAGASDGDASSGGLPDGVDTAGQDGQSASADAPVAAPDAADIAAADIVAADAVPPADVLADAPEWPDIGPPVDVGVDTGQGDVTAKDVQPGTCPLDCPNGPNCQAFATKETCNGKDDDCNGQTDDSACDDGNDCSLDACDPTAGCAHVNVPDGKACEVNKACTAGACKPIGGVATAPTPGALVITELMANPASVSDSVGEWFEVHNPGPNPIKLGGLVIADLTGSYVLTGNSLIMQPGAWLVFGRSNDPAKNGGLPVDQVYTKVTLNNASGDTLRLQLDDGTIIDQVAYSPAKSDWPKLGNGASYQLDPSKLDATSNDMGASWCLGTQTFGSGDLGTPGKSNLACP